MTVDIPTIEPSTIQSGDTVKWTKSLADYPANDSWVLAYRLVNRFDNYDITTSASDANHAVTISAATTAAYQPGEYKLIGWVTKAGEQYSIDTKEVKVKPNLAVIEGYDGRSTAQISLDALNEGLRKYAGNAWRQSYTIENRTMTFRSAKDFFVLRSALVAEVNREKQAERLAQGLGSTNRVRVRI